ncbi:MAG: type II toxin-antitoxin system VapC family toxin [Deltaproteobacteria bacterium]|nr:type II toxin-antitoxin system VapC family toxin [Deltaproteobacteria bacterium]
MFLPDVNVLLYAFRPDGKDHAAHFAWLDAQVNGAAAYGMSPQVLSAVVRISTHPRIFVKPSSREQALAFARAVMSPAHCTLVQPGPNHWMIFEDLCRRASATGNLVQDAWLAALAVESGCEWVTTDRDFARFPGLRWRTPF